MRFIRLSSALQIVGVAIALMVGSLLVQRTADGQAISMNGGSIQGTITDPKGAAIPAAKIVISNPETNYTHALTSDSAGLYSLGPLVPGRYVITVDAPGFAHEVFKTVVELGTVSSGNIKLKIGSTGETIEVSAGEVQVNTEQAGVAGVITSDQINTLPINGRNILDIAQIQPGVILQSGQTFDPTKTGYSALGVNGQNGRSTRILVDGQDVSDETVGTVLFNIPEGAIGEFQLNRANQDVSGEVTSTGQVIMSTQSGTNRFHGNAFGNFQDARAGFAGISGAAGDAAPFQRDQFGGYVGGPILKNKLFFFGGAERIKQNDLSPVSQSSSFYSAIYTQYSQVPDPFKDTFSIGRLDWSGPWGVHYFARAAYSNNISFGTSGQPPYAFFSNQDNVPSLVGGADFTTGRFTHSLRYGYLKFINNINGGADSLGNSIYNPSLALGIPFELFGSIYAGSGNEDAPQRTYQTSKTFRYDGTWTKGAHSLKYGGEVSRILQGGYAAFYNTMLADASTSTRFQLAQCASSDPIGGVASNGQCLGDPLYGYAPAEFIFGNGNGSSSERPAFGLPGGGDFSWRLAAYVGDTWKVAPYLTLVAGVRWSVDTDRANQDLATPTCGQVDPSQQFSGCDSTTPNTPLFDFYGPGLGLGKRTQQNWANFGPQFGLVYSPGSKKLVLRGGIGIYYENNLFNNGSNARAENTTAAFPSFTFGEITVNSSSITLPGYVNGAHGVTNDGNPCNVGSTTTDPNCIPLGTIFDTATPAGQTPYSQAQAIQLLSKLDANYKTASAVPQPSTAFIGTGGGMWANNAYAGPYKTPYSIQINGGAQYELRPGLVVSTDYIHNATLKVPITVDTNHVGAARFLELNAAKNAVAATLNEFGVTSIDGAIAAGATIDDFAGNGLTSSNEYYGGSYSASAVGLTPDTGAAFAGANTNVGGGNFILPVGKSAYDALQIVVQQQKQHPLPGILASNAQISYNLSEVQSNSKGGSNQFFAGSGAWDQDQVNKFIGRSDSDHSNMLSLSGSVTAKYGPQIALIGHFFSAPPSTLQTVDVGFTPSGTLTQAGLIFKSDFDGDGTTEDLLPGTNPGSYMHEIKGSKLNQVIGGYNSRFGGTPTPAGQALVAAGLFTTNELYQLGAVAQKIQSAPTNPLKNPATRTLDASFRYPIHALGRFREGLIITPTVTFYNVTNMANYGASTFSTLADTTVDPATLAGNNYLNAPNTISALYRNRTLRGTGNGTYDQGGPRTAEFNLKIDF